MSERHYWMGVASRDHALRGVTEGIVQANHGKPGNGLLLYAPKLVFARRPLPVFCGPGPGERGISGAGIG